MQWYPSLTLAAAFHMKFEGAFSSHSLLLDLPAKAPDLYPESTLPDTYTCGALDIARHMAVMSSRRCKPIHNV